MFTGQGVEHARDLYVLSHLSLVLDIGLVGLEELIERKEEVAVG